MVTDSFVTLTSLPEFSLWENMSKARKPLGFELELTARCNNNCRHCYINLALSDPEAKAKELSFDKIKNIADEAVSLGVLWCLITGGEPLLREDFFDIYLYLKKKGLLVSVFTNGTLISEKHIDLFKEYPPRAIEITVYGVTKDTYEGVTRNPGSFAAFTKGLNLLLENGIKVNLKTMAIRSNVREFPDIVRFCQSKTNDFFRFDPFLQLRFDANPRRNAEIKAERLSSSELIAIEQTDPQRWRALIKMCDKFKNQDLSHIACNHLFRCGAGRRSFAVSYDGWFRICSPLCHPDCIFDLKKINLKEVWEDLAPQVLNMRSDREEFLTHCHNCSIKHLCKWCPPIAHLETGQLDKPVQYFCDLAHARAAKLHIALSTV